MINVRSYGDMRKIWYNLLEHFKGIQGHMYILFYLQLINYLLGSKVAIITAVCTHILFLCQVETVICLGCWKT